jgi:uncharacterized protein YacL
MNSLNNCCDLWCLMASSLFGSMIYIMLNPRKSEIINDFQSSLSREQNQVYVEIVNERMKIYLIGLVVGLVLGFLYLQFNTSKTVSRTCVFTVLVLFTSNVLYLIAPKSKYMVTYLNTENQRNAWLKVYKEMQYRQVIGTLLGVIAYVLLSYNL